MKKLITILLAMAMMLALVACGSDSADNDADTLPSNTASGGAGGGTPAADDTDNTDDDADVNGDDDDAPAPAVMLPSEAEIIPILTSATDIMRLEAAIELAKQLPQSTVLDEAITVAENRVWASRVQLLRAKFFIPRANFTWDNLGAVLNGDWQPAKPLPLFAKNFTGTNSPHLYTFTIECYGDGNVARVAVFNGINIRLLDENGDDLLFADENLRTTKLVNGDAATIVAFTRPGTYTIEVKDGGLFFYNVYGSNLRGAVDVLVAEAFAKEAVVYKWVQLDEDMNPITVSYDEFGAKVTGAASIVPYIFNGEELALWSTTRIDLLERMGDPDAMNKITVDTRIEGVELAVRTTLAGGELNDYTITTQSLGIFIGNLNGNNGLTFIYGNHFDVPSDGEYYEFRIEVGKTEAQARELAKEYLLSNGVNLTGLTEFTLRG